MIIYKICPRCNSKIAIGEYAKAIRSMGVTGFKCPSCKEEIKKDTGLFTGLFIGLMIPLWMPFIFMIGIQGRHDTTSELQPGTYKIIMNIFDVDYSNAKILSIAFYFAAPLVVYLLWRISAYITAMYSRFDKV